MVTWETWRTPLLAAHGLCVVGVLLGLGMVLLFPERRAGRVGVSLIWMLLLACAITGGMLYPAFETQVLWERLGYTHGWGERLFRAKVHLSFVAIVPALLLPRLRRVAVTGQASPALFRVAALLTGLLISLALILCLAAEGLLRHGGYGG